MRCCIVRSACIAAIVAVSGACYDKPTCHDLGEPCPGDQIPASNDGSAAGATISSTADAQGGTFVVGSAGGATNTADGAGRLGGATGGGGAPPADASVPDGSTRDHEIDAQADAADTPESGEIGCEANASPYSEACVQHGIFVSPFGDDSNCGDKAHPLHTISQGLAAARTTRRTVYVCSLSSSGDGSVGETHDRNPDASLVDGGATADFVVGLELDSKLENVSLVGGIDCATWKQLPGDGRTRVKTPAGTVPLKIQNASGITIEGFEFEASDATADGQSSVAAFVSQSKNIKFKRVTFKAGIGKDGGLAKTSSNYGLDLPTSYDANGPKGGQACVNSCLDGSTSKGGAGGSVDGLVASGGENGTSNPPGAQPSDGLGGAPDQSCTVGGAGHEGANAPIAPGGLGASTCGRLDSGGWTPADGQKGSNGVPGQGGGGGTARISQGNSGGGAGGGCGGCGGSGGDGGKGGGSSFAFLSYQSADITLENCTLSTSLAGNGSKGADGEQGQRSVAPGKSSPGCNGGIGGTGGPGGAGGGGAGGLSVGIAYVGRPPTLSNPKFYVPTAHALGGTAGRNDPSTPLPAKDGIAGDSATVLALDADSGP